MPGSVFKIVTAIAGLGSGAITPETTFPEQAEAGDDGLLVNGFRIRNSHSLRQGQALTLGQATEISSNIYFALVGPRDRRGRTWPSSRSGSGSGRRFRSTCPRPPPR